jgi:hypothetical protein
MNSAQAPAATVERLGIKVDQLILEVGFDQSDCDQTIRDAITAKTGNKFLDATSQEVVDAVILWWRDGDGDLVDELVYSIKNIKYDVTIWFFKQKVGRAGYVESSDIQDAAPTAGMSQTTSFSACADWSATRLIARHAGSNKKKSK